MKVLKVKTSSEAETIELGRRMGESLKRGDVVGCMGELGAGKTTLIKGIALGLGVRTPIRSPSFIIITEYKGRFPIYHIDLYRIENTHQIRGEDILEYLYSDGVVLVEWAERVWHIMPPETIKVVIRNLGEKRRLIEIYSQRFRDLIG